MAALLANHFISMMRPNFDGNEVPHASRRNEQRRLFSKDLGCTLLQLVDCGIFSVNVVAHLGFCHRLTHFRCWPRYRVAAQIDHAVQRHAHLFQFIWIHSLIPFRHRITHLILFSLPSFPCFGFSLRISAPSAPLRYLFPFFFPLTSSIPQKPHSKRSISPPPTAPRFLLAPPIPPKSAVRIVPIASPHSRVRSAPHQFHPTAAAPKTTLPPTPALPSRSQAAPPAIAHSPPH